MFDPMQCLRDGVPLALGIDLLAAGGPDARHIFTDEPADLGWTHNPSDPVTEDASPAK